MFVEAQDISPFKHAVLLGEDEWERVHRVSRVVPDEDRIAICCDPNLILIRAPNTPVNVVLIDEHDDLPLSAA